MIATELRNSQYVMGSVIKAALFKQIFGLNRSEPHEKPSSF